MRQSGLPLIFNDVKVCDDAKATDEVCELRTRFSKTLRSGRRSSTTDFTNPFNSMSLHQFKQTVDSLQAFLRGGDTTQVNPGLFRRLAYHLVMNNFTVLQALEGLNIESCASFIDGVYEATSMNRAIATGTRIA